MHPRLHPRIALAITLLAASLSWAQEAQTSPLPGFELNRLEVNPGRGVGLMGSGQTLPMGGMRLSLLGDYERRPLVLNTEAGGLGLVNDRVLGLLSGAYGVFSWLEVGAQLPVVLWQRGQDPTALGLAAPSSQGLSTPLLHARVGLLSQRSEQPVDLAVNLGLGLPFGSSGALARDPGLRFHAALSLGGQLGWVRPALEAGILLRPLVPLGASPDAPHVGGPEVHLGAGLATLTGKNLNGELFLRATLPSSNAQASVEAMGGLRYQLRPGLELLGLGGPGLGSSPGTPRFRVLLGITYTQEPPPKYTFLDEASPPPLHLAPPRTEAPAEDTEQGPRPVKSWELNALTLTPREASAGETPPTADGSRASGPVPEQKFDNQQPFQPGPHDHVLLRGTILFAPSSSELPKAQPLLDQVLAVLQEAPASTTVLIEGHADNEGTYTFNRLLSLQRAQAVQRLLLSRGVPGERMLLRGFGSNWPASPNTTEEGRQLNRRVEIFVLSEPATSGGSR